MSMLRKVLNWLSPESPEEIEAEEENISFDRQKVDEEFRETIRSLRRARKTADAFVVAGELFVKDIRGVQDAKVPSRARKPK